MADQVVRGRQCLDCGHRWFTVEVGVPDYAVGWSSTQLRKPVLRVPMELSAVGTGMRDRPIITLQHEEAQNSLEALREANARRAAEAEARYGM
jgi:transcriptional regulator NrdR family protein